jgi:hypothetical protein
MKKFLFIILLGLFGQAQASGFDSLAPWTTSATTTTAGASAGSVVFNDNTTATLTGCYKDPVLIPGPFPGSTISVPQSCTGVAKMESSPTLTSGTAQFNWSLSADPATASILVWLLDSAGTALTLTTECVSGGFCSFDVAAGSIFGIALQDLTGASGNLVGPAIATITNFDWAANGQGGVGAVPLPPAFLLFGVALAGLGFVQKRKQQAAV